MEHKGLNHGDIVHLLSENKIVALGRVHTTEPSDLCHGELLGNGFCSISIDKCLDIQAYLPFPTIDASMVNEVVGGFVKWDIQNVKTVKEVEMNGHTYAATSPNDFIFEANGAPNTEDGISLRESWRERKVMLWSKENTEVLGYGVILLALPYEVINFDLLGEEDAGVVVDKSYNESAGTCTIDDLDCINLEDFEKASKEALALPSNTTDADKLILYGLFKQATDGEINTSRPGLFDMKGKAKWDAWKNFAGASSCALFHIYVYTYTCTCHEYHFCTGKSKNEAMEEYITKVKQLQEG
ncbi:hypothetical protein L7F22_061757 [Adiantum nelumboides]|nr:hypothetical protein [Adiantum nelumboides]